MKPSSFNDKTFIAAVGFALLAVALLMFADRIKRDPTRIEQASARLAEWEIAR